MKVTYKFEYLDYNTFKTPAVMNGEEGVHFEATAFLKRAQNQNVKITLAKAMSFTKSEIDSYPGAALERLFKASITSAKTIGIQAILVEPYSWNKKHSLDKEEIKNLYLDVAKLLEGSDTKIYIKNQYDIYNGSKSRGFLSDAYQLKDFIRTLNKESRQSPFALALDTGVANLCGQNIPELIRTLKDEIAMLIPIENNGDEDSVALPFSNITEGQSWINWLGIIKTLRKIYFDGEILMDIGISQLNVPPIMRPALLSQAKAIGHCFEAMIYLDKTIRKYDNRVLFGAGNMCRVYMEHFGEECPPLYVCDNNPALWGSQAFGLEIKSPESLKELSSDTAIFICNMYYDEILSQLQSMNLPNPIELFNDEIL